jgi:hypothetical protein
MKMAAALVAERDRTAVREHDSAAFKSDPRQYGN